MLSNQTKFIIGAIPPQHKPVTGTVTGELLVTSSCCYMAQEE